MTQPYPNQRFLRGNFAPLRTEVVEEHRMHAEAYELPAATAAVLPDGANDPLQYGWPEGDLALRTWIAERMV